MRTATVQIYTFDELSENAKDVARNWWRQDLEYFWMDDAMGSVRAFCDHFGVKIKDWSIGGYSPSWITTDAENANFRGVKLRSINRDYMPTGYCLDCALWFTFYDEFKRTGDALYAFNEAIDAAVKEIVEDIEYQYSDEAVDESIACNEYEFTEDGKIYR